MARWICSSCGSCMTEGTDSETPYWRFTGSYYEHKCPELHPQCGYFTAHKVPDEQATGGHPEFHKILEDFRALHVKKAADYGLGKDVLANCRGSEEFGIPGWIGVVMRMNDKMTRLKSFAQKGSLANESVEDSLLDLGCYAIIALILYREANKPTEAKA